MIDREPLNAPRKRGAGPRWPLADGLLGRHSPSDACLMQRTNAYSALTVKCFTPGDRQAPISLRCVEPRHMGNLG
jgi:hypothetical protein